MIKHLAILALAAVGAAAQAGDFGSHAWKLDVTQFRFPCAGPGCGVIVPPRPRPCVLPYCPQFPIPEPQPQPKCPPRAVCIDPDGPLRSIPPSHFLAY